MDVSFLRAMYANCRRIYKVWKVFDSMHDVHEMFFSPNIMGMSAFMKNVDEYTNKSFEMMI